MIISVYRKLVIYNELSFRTKEYGFIAFRIVSISSRLKAAFTRAGGISGRSNIWSLSLPVYMGPANRPKSRSLRRVSIRALRQR